MLVAARNEATGSTAVKGPVEDDSGRKVEASPVEEGVSPLG